MKRVFETAECEAVWNSINYFGSWDTQSTRTRWKLCRGTESEWL